MNVFKKILLAAGLLAGLAACVAPAPETPAQAEARQLHEIFRRWADAQGGARALKKCANFETFATIDYGPGTPKIEDHTIRLADGRFWEEVKIDGRVMIVAAYDGHDGWASNDRLGFGIRSDEDVERTLVHGDMAEPLKVEANYPKRRLLPDVVRDGKTYRCVELTTATGIVETWWFDVASGERVQIARGPSLEHPDGTEIQESAFTKIGPITVPQVFRLKVGGQTIVTTYQKTTYDPVVKDSLFQADPVQVEEGRKIVQILAKHLEAMGGMEASLRLKSRVSHVTIETNGVKMHLVMSLKVPDRVLMDADVPGLGHYIQGYDGQTGWVSNDVQGYRELKGVELLQLLNNANLRASAQLATRCLFRKWVGEKTIEGRKTYVVALATGQGPAGTYFFDAENGRLVQIESTVIAGPKSVLPVTMTFSDFRTDDGVTEARVTTTTNPAMRMVTTIESIENNVPLDDAIFKPRKDVDGK